MLVGLLALIGLAVDGGSMYTQRRQAQNASDGAAIAGTRQMLDMYVQMARNNASDVDGYPNQERDILTTIETYALKHHINIAAGSGDLEAYFVNDAKQIVSVAYGRNGCGSPNPCKVGDNNGIPWTYGAKGIMVRTRSHAPAFFMAVFGTNEVTAAASATAFMGVATSTSMDMGVMPIGFFTTTQVINNLQPGQEYTLIQGSQSQGSGNWGFVDWNGHAESTGPVDMWLMCGFNPAVTTKEQWEQWCPPYADEWTKGVGPTQYWQGQPNNLRGPFGEPAIRWPEPPNDWWWISGSTGTTNSTCQEFQDIAPMMLNREYLVPMFDPDTISSGQNTKFHLLAFGWFRITAADIQCHRNDPPPAPGPTPGPGTPTPTPQPPFDPHWAIRGEYLSRYTATASGGNGDIRHTSNPTVFLSP
jgi:hypothetical protein